MRGHLRFVTLKETQQWLTGWRSAGSKLSGEEASAINADITTMCAPYPRYPYHVFVFLATYIWVHMTTAS